MRVAVLYSYRKHLPGEVYDMYYFMWMDPKSGKRSTYIGMPMPADSPLVYPNTIPTWTRTKATRALDVLEVEWDLKR